MLTPIEVLEEHKNKLVTLIAKAKSNNAFQQEHIDIHQKKVDDNNADIIIAGYTIDEITIAIKLLGD